MELLELIWAILIALGMIYGCFCTNKKIVLVIYTMGLFIVNVGLIVNKQVVVNRFIDIFVSTLVFIELCLSYYIRYSSCKWLDKFVNKIIYVILNLFMNSK